MVEIASGSLIVGKKYTVGNITTPPGTGTVTYNSIVYAIGSSFIAQRIAGTDILTYSATLTAKVYEDDTLLTVALQNTSIIQDEIAPYPELLQIKLQNTARNFNENEEVVYPELLQVKLQNTARDRKNRSQIIRIFKYDID